MTWMYSSRQRGRADQKPKRSDLFPLELSWHALSVASRLHFLSQLGNLKNKPELATLFKRLPDPVRQDFIKHGFLEERKDSPRQELLVPANAPFFAERLQLMQTYKLLDNADEVFLYANNALDAPLNLTSEVQRIIHKALKINVYVHSHDTLRKLVLSPNWNVWVESYLQKKSIKALLHAFRERGTPLALARVHELLPSVKPTDVRILVEELINNLGLVEGLDPETGDILVGLASEALIPPPDLNAATLIERLPTELSLLDAPLIIDLRATLLELSCTPAQVKQDGSLYVKDFERIEALLGDWPDWMKSLFSSSYDSRLNKALRWANKLKLVRVARRGGKAFLEISKAGLTWLSSPPHLQFTSVFHTVAEKPNKDVWDTYGDHLFLGVSVAVVAHKHSNAPSSAHQVITKSDWSQLRRSLAAALSSLPPNTFFDLTSVLAYLSAPSRNPLLLGHSLKEVTLVTDYRQMILPVDEIVAQKTSQVLRTFILERLWPMGCVRLGLADKTLVMATTPRLPCFFDASLPLPEENHASATRVIVQPDFTVLVLGLDPSPATELAAFAARDRSSNTPGAVTFRLTRDDFLRGVHSGLSADTMLQRVKKLASTTLPPNIEEQLRTWGRQARSVEVRPLLVFFCPDEETSSRVLAALGKKGERLGPKAVGFSGKINSTLRQKLLAQGVLFKQTSLD